MRRSSVQFIFLGGSLALLAVGVYLALNASMSMPSALWLEQYPLPAVGLATVAGFADGLNPCAISTLLLFVGALLAVVDRAAQTPGGGTGRARRYVWLVASAFIAGIFLLYFSLGVGFVEITSLRVFGNTHLFTRLAGLVAVALGIVMVAEYLFPDSPVKLSMPASLHGLARRWGRKTTLGAAFVGGVLIGTCTIPCGGAMYLAVAALIGSLSSKVYGYGLLLSYNLAFILPLVLMVGVASSRPVLQRLSRLHITHRGLVKLVLGVFVILVGFFALL